MVDAIHTAVSGLQTASRQVRDSADRIANATTPPENSGGLIEDTVDLSEEAVKLKIASAAYKANVAVIKTAEENQDALLSILDETV